MATNEPIIAGQGLIEPDLLAAARTATERARCIALIRQHLGHGSCGVRELVARCIAAIERGEEVKP